MFQCSQEIKVVCSCECYCVFPVSIGNHRQVYCEVFLRLEACKSCSVSGIELELMTFRKSLLYFFVLSFDLLFRKTENLFVSCVIGSHRWQSPHIVAQTWQKFNMLDFFASTQGFNAKAGIACEHWCTHVTHEHMYGNQLLDIHVWLAADYFMFN